MKNWLLVNNYMKPVYCSITRAAEATGIRYGGICNCCRGAQYTSGGYYWEYVDD